MSVPGDDASSGDTLLSTVTVGGSGDLSAGTLPPTVGKAKAELGLEEHSHRLNIQSTVTNTALAFAAMLFMVAVFYGGVILYLLVKDPDTTVHWHASILVAAFVVPPTVMLVAVLRAVYASTEVDKDQTLLPVLAMVKDTAVTIASMFKKG